MASKRSLSLEGGAVNGDSRSSKRQRRNDQAHPELAPSWSNLNIDCRVHILMFLPTADIDRFAQCSKACNESANKKPLERTGTIVWTSRTTGMSFCRKLRQVQEKFTGNRTRLMVVGLDRRTSHGRNMAYGVEASKKSGLHLPAVSKLALCLSVEQGGSANQLKILRHVLPNLQELDLSGFPYGNYVPAYEQWPALSKITWEGCSSLDYRGFSFGGYRNLTNLCLDGCKFVNSPGSREANPFLLMRCRRLERLSVKDATFTRLGDQHIRSLPQDVLIEMVRRHPTLLWLRSDLTAENVAMLKQEGSSITFVSE